MKTTLKTIFLVGLMAGMAWAGCLATVVTQDGAMLNCLLCDSYLKECQLMGVPKENLPACWKSCCETVAQQNIVTQHFLDGTIDLATSWRIAAELGIEHTARIRALANPTRYATYQVNRLRYYSTWRTKVINTLHPSQEQLAQMNLVACRAKDKREELNIRYYALEDDPYVLEEQLEAINSVERLAYAGILGTNEFAQVGQLLQQPARGLFRIRPHLP